MKQSSVKQFLSKLGLKASEYSLKNITRIGKQRATSGWWVRIKNQDLQCSKTFYDKDYNNIVEAFQEAIKFRDKQPKHIKSNTGYEFISIAIQDKDYAVLKVTIKQKEKAFVIKREGYKNTLLLSHLQIQSQSSS